MSVTTKWDNDQKTRILVEINPPWNWQEFYDAGLVHATMLDTVPHRVNTIFYSPSRHIQIPSGAINHLRQLLSMNSPNEDLFVIVGGPQLLKSIMGVVRRVYGFQESLERYHFVDTLDEAYAIIAERERSYTENYAD